MAPAPETAHEQQTQADGGAAQQQQQQQDVTAALTHLLKLVHVSTRAAVLPAGPVPIELNFLVQSILGQTLLPHVSFEEGLEQCVKYAREFIAVRRVWQCRERGVLGAVSCMPCAYFSCCGRSGTIPEAHARAPSGSLVPCTPSLGRTGSVFGPDQPSPTRYSYID